jgi:UDP-N-acetylglucosamine--N-acetylmuramyl-(pentapeptide) pyrophosphoryl-undecaprenol N-acetylglucosamine transferase
MRSIMATTPTQPSNARSDACAGHPVTTGPLPGSDCARVVLLAGGGSGGHISPGLAIAERLREQCPAVRVIFACSERPIDARMLAAGGAAYTTLPAAPLSLRPAGMLRFLRGFRRARALAADLMRSHDVRHVVTLGGFVAAPVVVAANRLRIPVTMINLDSPPGKANRWLRRRCGRVISSVAVDRPPGFADVVVGVPIRRDALAPGDRTVCARELGLRPELRTLLVTGASQGSRSVNQLVLAMARTMPQVFHGWQVHHLSGEGDDGSVREAYAQAGTPALVQPFTDRMGLAWGAADLAISRAGANSVAEVEANAVPTLFLPYPWHKDRHQFRNAQPLVDAGAAVVETDHVDVQVNLGRLGPVLSGLMHDHERRKRMREAAARRAPADAAATIAAMLLQALGVDPEAGRTITLPAPSIAS